MTVISEKSLSIIFNSLNVSLNSHTFHAEGAIIRQEAEMHEISRYKTMNNGGVLHMRKNKQKKARSPKGIQHKSKKIIALPQIRSWSPKHQPAIAAMAWSCKYPL